MRVFRRTDSHLLCGHWNGSPVEIGSTDIMKAVPQGEEYHLHDYHEYHVMLRGQGALFVAGKEVPLEPHTVVMLQPGERHRVTRVDPEAGIQWIVIKERSVPNSKIAIPEPEGV